MKNQENDFFERIFHKKYLSRLSFDQNLNFGNHLSTYKIDPKLGHLSLKAMPKHFLNVQTDFEKVHHLSPPKWSKFTLLKVKCGWIFYQILIFWVIFDLKN